MKFETKNIPFELFAKFGMSKKDVLNLPAEDFKALLSGRTTSLQNLEVVDETGRKIPTTAKLSLTPLPDSSLELLFHPFSPEIQNDFKFNKRELDALKSSELVVKRAESLNSLKETYIYQLDTEINEVRAIRADNISIPNSIEGLEVTPENKEDLLKGKVVDLVNTEGEIRSIRVDLLNGNGYSVIGPQYLNVSSGSLLEKSSSATSTDDEHPSKSPSKDLSSSEVISNKISSIKR